jgi:hypothetical protein
MKLKTFLITLTFILGSNLTIAQEIKPDFKKNEQQQEQEKIRVMGSIKEIVNFNASHIGYSKFCNSGDTKSRAVLSHFNNLMGTLNLNETDSKNLENEFLQTMKISASGKNLPKDFTCNIFNQNFNLIYENLNKKISQ